LHLAAQGADTYLWLIRPLANAPDSSPAPLRLGLRPAAGGISLTFVKRRGPHTEASLYLPFETMPSLPLSPPTTTSPLHHALLDRSPSASAPAGSITAMLE
jgi:protein ImuA